MYVARTKTKKKTDFTPEELEVVSKAFQEGKSTEYMANILGDMRDEFINVGIAQEAIKQLRKKEPDKYPNRPVGRKRKKEKEKLKPVNTLGQIDWQGRRMSRRGS